MIKYIITKIFYYVIYNKMSDSEKELKKNITVIINLLFILVVIWFVIETVKQFIKDNDINISEIISP